MACRNYLRREGGQASIETAVALTIMLTMTFAVIEVALASYSLHSVSDAARAGTRYAMVRGSSCSVFASACPATAANVQTYVRGLTYPGIKTSSMTVTTTWPTNNNPGSLVKVTVSYPITLSIPYLPIKTATLTSTSEMVISR